MKLNEKKGSMADKKSYLNVFDLNQALDQETLFHWALLSLLSDKGLISSEEWENKFKEVDDNQRFKST